MSVLGTLGGTLGGVAGNPVGGLVSSAAGTAADLVLQRISAWVLNGTKAALQQVAGAIGTATAPNLNSTWFSSTYWRVAALAAMLTLPFLCAAAVQAVARADLSLLVRTAFGYLPLSVLGVSLAAPLTMLLLAATDQMCAAVSATAATGGARFLNHAAQIAGALAITPGGSPFFAVFLGLLTVMAALALAVELLVRAAAVYVVVLMLPLAFAALVWPARRVWAVRLVELLVSLILSKFAIVAVLSLAAAAFAGGTPDISELLVAMALILLSTFAPWALLRILPFTELAAGAAGILRNELPQPPGHAAAGQLAGRASEVAMDLPARLREQARAMYSSTGGGATPAADEPVGSGAATAMGAADSSAHGAQSPRLEGSGEPAQAAPQDMGEAGAQPGPPLSSSSPEPARASQERGPFVLPADWQSSNPMRLDEQLLRDPAQPDSGTEGDGEG